MNSEREERKKGEREREIGGLFGVGEYSTRLLARARAFTHTHVVARRKCALRQCQIENNPFPRDTVSRLRETSRAILIIFYIQFPRDSADFYSRSI